MRLETHDHIGGIANARERYAPYPQGPMPTVPSSSATSACPPNEARRGMLAYQLRLAREVYKPSPAVLSAFLPPLLHRRFAMALLTSRRPLNERTV